MCSADCFRYDEYAEYACHLSEKKCPQKKSAFRREQSLEAGGLRLECSRQTAVGRRQSAEKELLPSAVCFLPSALCILHSAFCILIPYFRCCSRKKSPP